jgi:hypothetical protein
MLFSSGLAQHLQDMALELRQFIQEEPALYEGQSVS